MCFDADDFCPHERTPMEEIKYQCPECLGEGFVEWHYADEFGRAHWIDDDCPVCEACGYLTLTSWKYYRDHFNLKDEDFPPEWIIDHPLYEAIKNK
jgi:hypothetical protein